MKIDIAVHGRFFAFDLARALISRGHDVRLLTNYPRLVSKRFGVVPRATVPLTAHGLATRAYDRVEARLPLPDLEAHFHRWFGSWAARRARREADLVIIFSGVAEELLRASDLCSARKWVVRGSAHIHAQHELLSQEEQRTGISTSKPSNWMLARETREYAIADRIVVLSSFARETFLAQGFAPDRLIQLTLGVDVARFRPAEAVLRARRERISRGDPLRVLTVGSFSARKGAFDIVEIARGLHERMPLSMRFVGDIAPEAAQLRGMAAKQVEFLPRIPEFELIKQYAWADLFVFPTIEDGFGAVLAQAQASGLPILATTNCGAPDLLNDGQTGWLLPIRSPEKFVERLLWCDQNRGAVAQIADHAAQTHGTIDFNNMAVEIERASADDRRVPCRELHGVGWPVVPG